MAKLSAEQIRNKFGLSFNQGHADKGDQGISKYGGRDDGAIYSTDTGEYIGTIKNFTPKDESDPGADAGGIGKFKKIQDYEIKHGFRDDERSSWNRMNDVAGAVNAIYGENTSAPAPAADPVQLSRTVAKAKAMERSYESAQRDGGLTQMAFGVNPVSGEQGKTSDAASEFLGDYKLNLKQYLEPGYSRGQGTAEDQRAAEAERLRQGPSGTAV